MLYIYNQAQLLCIVFQTISLHPMLEQTQIEFIYFRNEQPKLRID